MTFLTIITRTYKRPKALAACKASLDAQADQDFEQLLLVDDTGIGVAETYRKMARRDWSDVTGEYVYILDDDNEMLPGGVEALHKAAAGNPDLIIAKANLLSNGTLPPEVPEGEAPQLTRGRVDIGCACLRRDVFVRAIKYVGIKYDGDYDYIHAAQKIARQIVWINAVIMRAQRISHGAPE